jgi:hypothetical protein
MKNIDTIEVLKSGSCPKTGAGLVDLYPNDDQTEIVTLNYHDADRSSPAHGTHLLQICLNLRVQQHS